MKSVFRFIAFGLVGLTAGAFAQYVRLNTHVAGYGTDVFYGSAYDQHSVVRFKAKVKGLSKTPGRPGEANDCALLVLPFTMGTDNHGKSVYMFAKDYVPVELGPEWFVADQSTKIKMNDYVEITGSRMVMNGTRFIMAQMVRKGSSVLAVRRMSGEPFWYPLPPELTPAQQADADKRAAEAAAAAGGSWGPQQEGQQVWNFTNVQVYGDAWPIGGSQSYNVSGFVPNIRGYAPTRPVSTPIVIQGYWYNGPPTVVRY